MNVVQFCIPHRVAHALPIERVAPAAREYGITQATLAYRTGRRAAGVMRVSCSIDVAMYLVAQLQQLTQSQEGCQTPALGADCDRTAEAVLAAVEAELRQSPVA